MPEATPTPQIQVSKTNDAPVKYYKTRDVNKALEDANSGDTVVLAPGDYTGFDIFVPEDVYLLAKPGAILGYEFGRVNGFKRNIADLNVIGGAQKSEDLGGPSGVIYYIRPLRGTAIKNSNPDTTLAIELHRIKEGEDIVVDSGDIQLFYQNQADEYKSIVNLDEDSDGYFAELGREDIDGSRKVFVMDSSKPLTENNIFDSITLADIQDGHGFVGWVNVTPGLTSNKDEDGEYSPSFIEMDPNFTFDGEVIDIENDDSFQFTSTPDDEEGIDVFGVNNKVEVDAETYFGSREKKQYSANWAAEYTDQSGKKFTFQLVETVYEAEDGTSSQTLQIIAQSQAFKVDKDGVITPDRIRLRASTQNISGVGSGGGATIDWTIDDTNPNGLNVTLEDEQGDPTQTGQEVYIRGEELPDDFTSATIRASVDDSFVREPPVEDEITVAKLIDGDPGFTVVLSNENHTFPVQGDGTITSQDYSNGATSANVWRGTELFSYDQNLSQDGTWRFQEFSDDLNEVTPEGAIDMEVDPIVGRVVPSNMTFPNAVVAVTLEARYKNDTRQEFQRQITYNKAQSGKDIKRLQLAANSQIFKVFEDGTVDPDPDGQGGVRGKITLQALLANIEPNADDEILWSTDPEYVLGTDIAPGDDGRISSDGEEFGLFYEDLKNTTGNTVDDIDNGEFANQVTVSAKITVDGTEYSDEFTIFRLEEGTSAYTLALTNEAHSISTNSRGIPLANQDPDKRIPGSETDIRLFRGIQEITEGSDTTLEISGIDDVGKLKQTFPNDTDPEIQQGDTLTLGGDAASPPEIYVSDIDFQVESGDNTATVDVTAKHVPNQDDGEQVVGRKTWNISTAQKGNEGIQWVIKPLNGSAIKNSDPNKILTFEARKIIGETSIVLEQVPSNPDPEIEPQVPESVADLAIYVRNPVGGGDFEYLRACNVIWDDNQSKFVLRSDTSGTQDCHPDQGTPLKPRLGTDQVQGQTTLYLLRSATGNDDMKLETANGDVEAVLDEVDVVDVLDGLNGGYLEVLPERVIQVVQTQPDGGGFVQPENGTNLEPIGRFTKEGVTSVTNSFGPTFDFAYDKNPSAGSGNQIYVVDAGISSETNNDAPISIDTIKFVNANSSDDEITSKNALLNDSFGTGSNDREISGFDAVRVSYTFISPDTEQETSVEDTFPVRKEAGARYFIQPEGTGTAIKNKSGTVDLRAFKVQPNIEGREELDMYTVDGDGRDFALVDSSDNIVGNQVGSGYGGSDPYRLEFDTNAISEDIDLSLKQVDDQGSPVGNVLDSITAVDVTDGSDAVIASIQASTSGIDSDGNLQDAGSDTTLGFTYDPNVNKFDPPVDSINDSNDDDYFLIATFFRQGNVIEHDGQKARAALRVKFNEGQGTIEPNGTSIPNTYTGSTTASDGFEYNISVSTNDPNNNGTRSLRGRFAYSSDNFLENSYDLVEQVVVSPGGIDGDNAKVVRIEAESLTFREDGDGNITSPSDGEITLTAKNEDGNIGSPTYEWSKDGSKLSGLNPTDTLDVVPSNAGSGQVALDGDSSEFTVEETNTNFTDTASVFVLREGSDAITPILSNEAHTFQADNDGTVDNGEWNQGQGNNVISVYQGATKLSFSSESSSHPSSEGEYNVEVNTGEMIEQYSVKSSGNDAEFVVENVDQTSGVTSGQTSITVRLKKADTGAEVTVERQISYSKSLAGSDGQDGNQGPAGPGVVYRGDFDDTKTYYHRDDRRDVVSYDPGGGTEYYLTDNTSKNDTDTWNDPTTSDWTTYGQQFESVATDFLLAQDATITNTLTMGESSSDSGLIRSAVNFASGSDPPELLYEIGKFVDSTGDGSSDGEGIRFRNTDGNVVFSVFNDSNKDAEISNLDITGGVTVSGGIDSESTVDGSPIYSLTKNSIVFRDSNGEVFKTNSSGVSITGSVNISGGDLKITSSNNNDFLVGDFSIGFTEDQKNDIFTTELAVSVQDGTNSDSKTINVGTGTLSGGSVEVSFDWEAIFGDPGGTAKVELILEFMKDGVVKQTEKFTDTATGNNKTTAETLIGSAGVNVSTDEIRFTRKVFQDFDTDGSGTGSKYKSTNQDATLIKLQSGNKDFIGPVGARWRDSNDNISVQISRNRGSITAKNSISVISDARKKDNIRSINNPKEKLMSIDGVSFNKEGKKYMGVIAQDVKEVAPESVSSVGDILAVDYNALQALQIEAIKNHEDRISKLENLHR